MGTYAGFFLPSVLIPIFTLWAYYASFMKYAFEALEWNEWGNCASTYMINQFLSLDVTLNRWTNILVLMAYPIGFHLLAVMSSLRKTGDLKCGCRRTSKPSPDVPPSVKEEMPNLQKPSPETSPSPDSDQVREIQLT